MFIGLDPYRIGTGCRYFLQNIRQPFQVLVGVADIKNLGPPGILILTGSVQIVDISYKISGNLFKSWWAWLILKNKTVLKHCFVFISVRPPGLEPGTQGLRVLCSTN